MSQLALPLKLADHAVFASFLSDGNETLVASLKTLATNSSGKGCWLWGSASSGRTHLLQAACEAAGDLAIYLPLSSLLDSGPAVLEGLAQRRVVCLDDIDAVAGKPEWELQLFGLCNALDEEDGRLAVTAANPPRKTNFRLADLGSRLSRLAVFQVRDLDEAQRQAALQLRAQFRGLELPDEVARYLLRRSRRDMTSLYALLDRLDDAALRAQRRLTVPFVSDVLRRTVSQKPSSIGS